MTHDMDNLARPLLDGQHPISHRMTAKSGGIWFASPAEFEHHREGSAKHSLATKEPSADKPLATLMAAAARRGGCRLTTERYN
jgi:hypothetical protein